MEFTTSIVLVKLADNRMAFFTVRRRRNTVLSTISEIRSVVNDYRRNACGGLVDGLEIWETGIIPMLLYNVECWININKNTIEELESPLQRRFLRSLLGAGSGRPFLLLGSSYLIHEAQNNN